MLTATRTVHEGSTHTYSYTVSDPGMNDTFTVSAGYPELRANGDALRARRP